MKRERLSLTHYLSSKKNTKTSKEKRPYREPLKRLVVFKTQKNLKQQVLRYDTYVLTPVQWLLYGGQGLLIDGLFTYIFYRSIIAFFVFLPVALAYPMVKRKDLKEKRLQELNLEFKEGISLLSSFLSAGYSVENAFDASVKELVLLYGEEGVIVREFKYIVNQIRTNRNVEQALLEFANRSSLDDVKNFAEVFGASKRSGGELVSVIGHTADVIRDKVLVRQEIMTMTASKQFEQKIMNMIPFLIVLYIDMTSPGFFNIMYTTIIGKILMTACMFVYIIAFLIARQIMNIEI